ncbi:hypothetical protein PTB13_13445, partial [Bacillus sp. MHSD17]|nr:hypothetical protein [Bacillus sp. MHSD17]
SVSQGVAAYICLPKTAWPPTFLTMRDKRYLIFYRRGVSSGKNISSRENSSNRIRTIKGS